ncbi:putative metal-binding protein [Bradyrhizobium arachidis]|uniref:putative metal-binding protein n=1 Tax=Bradyrhizobium arachidis TaxID=858423 RepID=UPI002161EE75|nr:putative metal-binding protein [Bradyrhizobium arachidis]UVO28163.1 hypothetical protein KUF59_37785 [Bradyrhizobium arachidis]
MHEALARANFEQDVAALSDAAASRLGLVVHSRTFPIFDVTIEHKPAVRLRFHGEDFDERPPGIDILKPDGSNWAGPMPPGGVFNGGPHSVKGGPFICMRGSREYHTHSSHVNDNWANYRKQEGMGIVGILLQLNGVWRKGFP